MAGINNTLEIARNALLNSQTLIQTASHNIANADNKTYARQKVLLATNPPIQIRDGWTGMGASVERIIQQRDQFIEQRLLGSISREAEYNARAAELSIASGYLLDTGDDGLSQVLGEFWDAWNGLNNHPGGTSEQDIVKQSAQNLASSIQSTYRNLSEYADGIKETIWDENTGGGYIDQANDLLDLIAGYNKEITRNELHGQMPANDLRDLRYKALTELAELLPVEFTEEANGSLTVTLDGGSTDIDLVSGNVPGSLSYDGSDVLMTPAGGGDPAVLPVNTSSGGRIPGSLSAYRSIGTYLDQLNAFASNLIEEVNREHGTSVFDPSVIAADFNAGDIVALDFEPDSTKALGLAEFREREITGLESVTFSKYLSNMQQRIGSDVRTAEANGDFQAALRQQLETQQQSVSGVSLDEEMVDLLKFQHAYQAAAKVVEKAAEMLNRVIDMV